MRAVVTGGAGFIGSTLVDRLLDEGWQVDVVDDLSSGVPANLARALQSGSCALHRCDISEPATVSLLEHLGPDVVFHLAAQADVRVSVADPGRDAAVNVLGTVHVAEGARRGGARKVVFASSGGTIYGEPDPALLPLDESIPQRPVSPYGVAKKAGGDYLYAFGVLHGLSWTALALANVYGPRQDPHGEAGVVAIFAGRLLAGEECVVFGDGDQTRDFVHVDDVVRAFVMAAERADGLLLNIGTGVETSVNALYAAMARAAGTDRPPRHEPARPGELLRSALDPSAARRELGWEPDIDVETGCGGTLRWFAGS